MQSTVVLVHGIRTSATMWRAQREALGREGVRSIAVDLPGHGSRIGDPFTLDEAMRAIDDGVRSAADDGPVILCGLSLGGYLVLHYAGGPGGRLLDGVLAASCGTRPGAVPLTAYRAAAALIGAAPDRGARLNQFMVDRFLPPAAREDVGRGGVALEVMGPTLAAMASVRPLDSIARIRTPILFVNGVYDHFRLEERLLLKAARKRPGIPEAWSQLVHIPGANHMVSLVRPEEFSRVLVASAVAARGSDW